MTRSNAEGFETAVTVFGEYVHQAWRSTKLPLAYNSPVAQYAMFDSWTVPGARDLCRMTSRVILHAVTDLVLQDRDIQPSDIYQTMEDLYVEYQIHTTKTQMESREGAEGLWITRDMVKGRLIAEGILTESSGTDYATKDSEYKEIDRRIVMAGFATLLNPWYRLYYWDDVCKTEQLLKQSGIRSAAEDGQALLDYQSGTYNPEAGFAREATLLSYPKSSQRLLPTLILRQTLN